MARPKQNQDAEALRRELAEAREQQAATSEILRVIASSPTDLQPVLDTLAENAARLCAADDAQILRIEGDVLRRAASYGSRPTAETRPITRETVAGRAVIDRDTIHVYDLRAAEKQGFRILGFGFGESRTLLSVPLLREGIAIGAILIRRFQVRPFLDSQIELLKTFADQAVIAIENVRLFNELKESLEQQTVTSEILGVIASSPTDIQPVLDVVAQRAAQICDARDAQIFRVNDGLLRLVASYGPVQARESAPIIRGSVVGRAVVDREIIHVHDLAAAVDTEFPESKVFQERFGDRTALAIPLLRENAPIGAILIRRFQVRPFTHKQIALLNTFADQAVIAIENVRLIDEIQERNAELREALEHQTATAEVLGIISRSPTDVQPVLDAIVESAARVCGVDDVMLRLRDAQSMVARAHYGPIAIPAGRVAMDIDGPWFRWIREHGTLHVPDARTAQDEFPGLGVAAGFRSYLSAPLRQKDEFIGELEARRLDVQPFTPAQIKLLETFADQAMIAIENVRLFKELQERNRQLTVALEQQTATSEVLKIISSSPADLGPVFETILRNITRLCASHIAHLALYDGQALSIVAQHGATAEFAEFLEGPRQPGRETPTRLAALERRTVHVADLLSDPEFSPPSPQIYLRENIRTVLSIPMLREDHLVGVVTTWRREIKPFTDEQVALVQTFADQAVIAIANVRLFQELKESLEQQTATSEILGVIANSPTDIQPVLNVVAENAAKLCDATDAVIFRMDANVARSVASYGSIPLARAPGEEHKVTRGAPPGRAMLDGKTVHVHDIAAEFDKEFPESRARHQISGSRSILATPLLREGVSIGAIMIRRTEVRPFSEKQIKLLESFASQAVIAIENVRLFKELQDRNRDLTEALEQQTATSEILRVIASSPTEIQPVLDIIARSAAQLCGADDAVIRRMDGDNAFRGVAHFGFIPIARDLGVLEPVETGGFAGRALREGRTLHVHDLAAAEEEFPGAKGLGIALGVRTALGVPLLRHGKAMGLIHIRRLKVLPFTERQIKLVETFADQAVIAIENVRLFQELKEALEQQTATSEILGVIASSPTDIQPVLDAVAANAARVCGADDAVIRLIEDGALRMRSHYGPFEPDETPRPIDRRSVVGRAVVDRQVLHIPDLTPINATEFPESQASTERGGIRTVLAAPLQREGVPIGVIFMRRTEVRPFTDKQVALLRSFADQAVIAIENVRLFRELEERNRDLTEALEQQTATSEILRVIASSPTDIQPVLDVVAKNAARLCEASDALIYRIAEGWVQLAAQFGDIPVPPEPMLISRGFVGGRAIIDRKTVHVHDVSVENETEYPQARHLQRIAGARTVLGTPLLRQGEPIGSIVIRRQQVRPFTETQIKLLETFADQAVIAIENVRLFNELQERTRELAGSVGELKALGEVGQAVSSSLDLENVLATIVAHAVRLSGTDCGVIYEYDDATREFHLRASHRMEEEIVEALRAAPIHLGEGVTGQAVATRAPVQVANFLEQPEYTGTRVRPMLMRLGYRSLLSVPLFREHQILGGLTVWRRQSGNFATEVVNLLQTFATQSALAIQNARLFREIEDKSRQIGAANRHKSEFLANMSHELRTPLNAIIGFSEVLSEKMFGELNEKQSEYVDDIYSSGRHLLSLINDILDLSKVEAGRMELDVATFDLPLAIENALTLVRERAMRHGIALHHRIDERIGEVRADERKVKQILLNLLSNAVKFTPEGGRIEVEAAPADATVQISVRDTGVGIALEDQETIFEEFRQVGSDYAHKREGTGLGLTLTKKFVQMHGGKIWVESQPGKGSTFIFTLPRR